MAGLSRAGGVLIVAATASELEGIDGAATLCCGIGPVEAAAATARALEHARPGMLLHIGIAGARSLEVPSLVLGSESLYCDLHAGLESTLPLRARCAPDLALLERARRALPAARVCEIGTSAQIGGAGACEVEAMEGFGVLRAAEAAGVAAVELRAISNRYGDPRARWRVDEAIALLAPAVAALLGAHGA